MRLTNSLDYEGETWKYVSLDFDPRMSEELKNEIVWNTIDMHKKGHDIRSVRREVLNLKSPAMETVPSECLRENILKAK